MELEPEQISYVLSAIKTTLYTVLALSIPGFIHMAYYGISQVHKFNKDFEKHPEKYPKVWSEDTKENREALSISDKLIRKI